MIHSFTIKKLFLDMVELYAARTIGTQKILRTCTNNSYDHRAFIYIFDNVIRGIRFEPMTRGDAWWFSDDTDINEIINEDTFMGYFFAGFLQQHPEYKLPKNNS